MGDPLKKLEERLERMVPQGLSDHGRERLEGQIDELASGLEEKASGLETKKLVAVAAGLAILAAAVVFVGLGLPGDSRVVEQDQPAAAVDPVFGSVLEPVDFLRLVAESPSDGGYVQGESNMPFRTWIYPVREEETVVDKDSGWEIVIISEHEEQILTPVKRY